MTFLRLNMARFIGLDPVANILYPALLGVFVAMMAATAVGLVFLDPSSPWWLTTMAILMLVGVCHLYGDGYRHYLTAEFERSDAAISAPLTVGMTSISAALAMNMVEPSAPLWLTALAIAYGALNLWLTWRMTGVRANLRYGGIRN